MKNIIITEITTQELKDLIIESVKDVIGEYSKEEKKKKFLSRKEAAKLLHLSLPTLSFYTKSGKIKGYRMGNKIMYEETELIEALTVIETLKYQRG